MLIEKTVEKEVVKFVGDRVMFGRFKKLHFVGIGGAGMSGIAEILFNLGYAITGSDSTPSEVTDYLKSLGILVSDRHAAENLAPEITFQYRIVTDAGPVTSMWMFKHRPPVVDPVTPDRSTTPVAGLSR